MAGLVLWGPVHSWDVELDDTHRHADAHTLEFLAASVHHLSRSLTLTYRILPSWLTASIRVPAGCPSVP